MTECQCQTCVVLRAEQTGTDAPTSPAIRATPHTGDRAADLHTLTATDDVAGRFLADVWREVIAARAKFPGGDGSMFRQAALGEEYGEAVRALLHIHEGKGGESELYGECVQTAAIALRLALEGDDRETWAGNTQPRKQSLAMAAASLPVVPKRGCGGSYEVGSGGHVPGTPGEGCAACDRDFGDQRHTPRG